MPQKSATTTNTNTPSLFIIEPYNSPPPSIRRAFFMPQQMPPSTEGFFHAPTNAPPNTPCRAPFHTMQNTHPRHAKHASTPCRAPFHTMQNTLPRHAEHASTPSKCPLTTYASRERTIIPSPHQKKGAPTSRRNTRSHIFNSPPLGWGWGWVSTAPPPRRSCPRCRHHTPPPSGR